MAWPARRTTDESRLKRGPRCAPPPPRDDINETARRSEAVESGTCRPEGVPAGAGGFPMSQPGRVGSRGFRRQRESTPCGLELKLTRSGPRCPGPSSNLEET